MKDQPSDLKRRKFLKNSGMALGMAGLAGMSSVSKSIAAESAPSATKSLIAKNDTILFQGDSITDAGRDREKAGTPNSHEALGDGYAWMAALELLVDRPGNGLAIHNRGVSGNKVYQLAERWEADCLELKPNVVSILIGVNDFWHTVDPRINYKGTVEIYEKDYHALVERTIKALPGVKLVICEPFVQKCGVVKDTWFPEFDHYRAAAKRVAEAFHATFIPFQAMFEQATKFAPPEYWARDGVHPSAAGVSLMAHNWFRAVNG